MFWSLFFAVLVAVLAAFGLACGIRMIVEACFPDRRIFTVVEIQTLEDADVLDLLLIEDLGACIGKPGRTMVAVCDAGFAKAILKKNDECNDTGV